MPKFRKKPVVIDAEQYVDFEKSFNKINDFCPIVSVHPAEGPEGASIAIHTLEGSMTISPGDYLIKGVNGEFYPCKPDIFAATYEPVTDDE